MSANKDDYDKSDLTDELYKLPRITYGDCVTVDYIPDCYYFICEDTLRIKLTIKIN